MTLDELVESLRLVSPWQRRAVVIACVQRVQSVIEKLADDEAVEVFRDYAAALWDAVEVGLNGGGSAVLDRRLLDALDMGADDPYRPDYYAIGALDLLNSAARAFKDTSDEAVADVFADAVDLWDSLETQAYAADSQTWVYTKGDPREPGRLERFEIDESRSVLDSIRHKTQLDPPLLESLQIRARTPSGPLEEILSSLITRMGWL